MKKFISIFIICTLLVLSTAVNSWSRRYHHYHGCGSCNNGWTAGAAIAGSLLIGTVVGSMITQSVAYAPYGPPPRRVYVYPQPNLAYASPDPEFVTRYSQKSSGEWILVPGQSVNGKWVPEHKVWVPVSP